MKPAQKPRSVRVWVGQGWTHRQAFNRGRELLPRGKDYRGFKYDARDGYAVFT